MSNTELSNRSMEEKLAAFEELLTIMSRLRKECPWDSTQTFESIRSLTIEETYELADAILKKDMNEVKKELGDLLLHLVFYAEMGSETDDFDIKDICDTLNKKLIYRHPHIFSDINVSNSKDVEQNWETLKLKEKGGNKTVLDGVPNSLPSLIKAYRIQDKARNVGFDWEEKEQVWDKVQEEFNELQVEIKDMDTEKMEGEFGDLLFSIINAARLYNIDPENALEKTNQKFIRRFNYLEEQTLKKGRDLKQMSLDEMEEIWKEGKIKGL